MRALVRGAIGATLVAAAISVTACPASAAKVKCADFQYQEQAQEFFDGGGADYLDGDSDGLACENNLPAQPRSVAPALGQNTIYRFWSPGFNNAHFFTGSQGEADHIRAVDANWIYEGRAFSGWVPDSGGCASGVAVHRFYSPVFQSHFYTASQSEKDSIVANDRNWTYEGVAYCASTTPVVGGTALYRFWSPKFGKHFYTASRDEQRQLRINDPNWTYEGIAYYVAS